MYKKLFLGLVIISNVCNINAIEIQPQNIDQNNFNNFSYFIYNVVNEYNRDYTITLQEEITSEIFTKYNRIDYSSNYLIDTAIADVNCKTLYDIIILNIVEDKIHNLFEKKLINQPIQLNIKNNT